MDHAWDVPPLHDPLNISLLDVPPLHDPLNISLLDVTHKLHVRLKAYIILVKLTVRKMLREVCAEGYDGRLKQPKPLL